MRTIIYPELPPYTIPQEDADLLGAGCVVTRTRLHETWMHAGLARRCAVCQRVFWRTLRGKHVDRGGRLVPNFGPDIELRPNERYCGLASCYRAASRQKRNMTGTKRKPVLGWMSTVSEAAAAMDVREEDLLGFIERHSKPDLYGEVVSRLSWFMLEDELFGGRVSEPEPGLVRLLRLGIVCRRVASWKRDTVPSCFHGQDGSLLTAWIVFVRSYEGKPAEEGDTSTSTAGPVRMTAWWPSDQPRWLLPRT